MKKEPTFIAFSTQKGGAWKSHATLTLLATQDCPLWLQYDLSLIHISEPTRPY